MTTTENQSGSGYADEVREHEFDGIQEFDNHLPNWWLWTFYLACIFSLFYWLYFHVLPTDALPGEVYKQEMAAHQEATEILAAARSGLTDESLMELSQDQAAVAAGKALFEQNCAACHQKHGASMPAGVGPNLTDEFWIHGGSPMQIHKTVNKGVLAKGMQPWEGLGDTKVRQLVAFVLTLRNTKVAGGKEPQGEPYEGE